MKLDNWLKRPYFQQKNNKLMNTGRFRKLMNAKTKRPLNQSPLVQSNLKASKQTKQKYVCSQYEANEMSTPNENGIVGRLRFSAQFRA